MGRQAGGPAEHPGEVERREIHRRRQFLQRRRLDQPRGEQLAGAGHGQRFVAGGRRLGNPRVAAEQHEDRLAPAGLLLQRAGAGFQQAVQADEDAAQFGILQHAGSEGRQAAPAQLQFVEHPGDLADLGIEGAVQPALVMGPGAGMHLVRVDQHHAADRRQVVAAAMMETLRAVFDHGEDETLVDVRGEALLDVAGVQQLHATEVGGAPEAGLFSCCGIHGRCGCEGRAAQLSAKSFSR
ncbi:hypothetical protein D9M71_165920 [compost metagenome]